MWVGYGKVGHCHVALSREEFLQWAQNSCMLDPRNCLLVILDLVDPTQRSQRICNTDDNSTGYLSQTPACICGRIYVFLRPQCKYILHYLYAARMQTCSGPLGKRSDKGRAAVWQQGALVMPLMARGFQMGVVKFNLIAARKP